MQWRNEKNRKAILIKSNNLCLDFKKVKDSGVHAVIFKVSYGLNPYKKALINNIKKAKESGLLIGVYKEFDETSSPNLQGFLFSRILKKYDLDLYPILSIKSNKHNLSKKEFSDKCLKFMNIVKKNSGNECVIKASTRFANNNLDDRIGNNKFWSMDEDKDAFKHNKIWDDWDCFNCNKKHIINGINNKFELGEIKKSFIKTTLKDEKLIKDKIMEEKLKQNKCNCGHYNYKQDNCNCGHCHHKY